MKICLTCEREFENRSSNYCSVNCARNSTQIYDDTITKLFSNGFECIADSEKKVFEFISKIRNKEHSILLFTNENIRDTIVTEFLDKSKNDMYTACFSHNENKFRCDKVITYNELTENQILLVDKISDFLIDVLDKTYPRSFPRIACEDTAWFTEAGFFEEHQKLGNKLDKKVIEESAILCCYNTKRLDKEKLDTVLESRDFVIVGEPLSVFRRK